MKGFAEILRNVADTYANFRGQIPRYNLRGSKISVSYVNKSSKEDHPTDVETYSNAQLTVGEYANPVYIDYNDIEDMKEEYDVILSQEYKTFMRQNVIREALFSEAFKLQRIQYLIIGNIVLTMIVGLIAAVM